MTRIAILRAEKLPNFVTWELPNLDELFEEDNQLIQGFEERGCEADHVAWNDPRVDWDQFDGAVIRSTYDYLDAMEDFLRVLEQIESSRCRLFNSLAAIQWNINKRYLFDLQEQGVPIVPTHAVSRFAEGALSEPMLQKDCKAAILKPAIGLGGSLVSQAPVDTLNDKIEELRLSDPYREYLIQPFVDSIVSEGEWSFVYFNGQFSHALLKKPAPGDFRVQEIYGGSVHHVQPQPGDLGDADAVMDALLRFDPLYARVDMARIAGRLCVMEVELIEPILYFNQVPVSIARLVSATQDRFARVT